MVQQTSSSSPSGPGSPGPAKPGPTAVNDPKKPTAPTTPGGPTQSGPVTGGPANLPPTGVAAGRTGARGAALLFERSATSKDRLRFDWAHPVVKERESGTAAAGPLPLEEALKVLWENDQRPLLVLRECDACQGTDLPLLDVARNNDRTMLLSKWFRVVRLPTHVAEPSHPLHNVFEAYTWDGPVPHFFLLSHPTAKPVAFTGGPTQQTLWKGMLSVLRERYMSDPAKAAKQYLALLDQFDIVDAKLLRLNEELLAARAEKGPDSDRAKDLTARLADAQKEREDLLATEKKVLDLGLMPFPKSVAAAK